MVQPTLIYAGADSAALGSGGLIKKSPIEGIVGPALRRELSTDSFSKIIASEGLALRISHSEPLFLPPENCVQCGYPELHRAEPISLLLGVVF